jgi:multidrug efflux pump subunit AcrA (membrane-fusion protein)
VKGVLQTDWKGKIISIVPRSEWQTGSRGFPVEVRVKNRFQEVDGQRMPMLKEGMMAEVTFTGTPIEAIMVPKNALLRTTEGMRISVIDLDAKNPELGTSRFLLVEPGMSEGAWIQVLVKAPVASRDLVAGMQVVTEGAERLKRFPTEVRIAPEPTGLDPNSSQLD